MASNERSAIIVRRHRPLMVPAEAPRAGLTSTIAVVLSTHRSHNPDLVIDHELWLACMAAVGASVGATASDVFLEPKRSFLGQLRRRRRGPTGGSLEQYAARIRTKPSIDDWDTILWRAETALLAAATCERWYMAGGPMPYHDSYTTSLFIREAAREPLVDALRANVAQAGGWIDAVVD